MRKRIDSIKEVLTREEEALRAKKDLFKPPPPRRRAAPPSEPEPDSTFSSGDRAGKDSGYAGLLTRIMIAAVLILALLFAANEVMVYLLK